MTTKKLTAPMPGAFFNEGCHGCDPVKHCLPCEYLYENGGQCGGCHVFYIDEERQEAQIEWIKSLDETKKRMD